MAADAAPENGSVVIPEDIAAMSFEQALAELEGIVQTLEQGRGPLDEAISGWERGVALRMHCEERLKQARARIEKVTLSPDGTPATGPLDPE